jgi:hypothetical protein
MNFHSIFRLHFTHDMKKRIFSHCNKIIEFMFPSENKVLRDEIQWQLM